MISEEYLREYEEYCPICQRVIVANNLLAVQTGEQKHYLFIHDDIEHTDEDMEALKYGIN